MTVAVHCDEQRELIVAAKPNRPIDIYLKMNSGMNRLGFAPENFRDAWERASASPGIGAISLMTHFANADEGEVDWQLHSFDRATRDIPGARSLSNSAATMWHKRAHRDWVSPTFAIRSLECAKSLILNDMHTNSLHYKAHVLVAGTGDGRAVIFGGGCVGKVRRKWSSNRRCSGSGWV